MDRLVVLPRLDGRFEDVDYGMLGREDVVVAWGNTDAAEVVLEVDAWEAKVGEGGGRGMGSIIREAWHHGLHVWSVTVRHRRLVDGGWRLNKARHAGILGHVESAGAVGRWWAGVVAVNYVVTAATVGMRLSHCI